VEVLGWPCNITILFCVLEILLCALSFSLPVLSELRSTHRELQSQGATCMLPILIPQGDTGCLGFFLGHITQGRTHAHMCLTFPSSFDVDVFSPAQYIEVSTHLCLWEWLDLWVDVYSACGPRMGGKSGASYSARGAGNWSQGLAHCRHVLNHCAVSPAPTPAFWLDYLIYSDSLLLLIWLYLNSTF
jgi:hypothetical protein